MKALPHPRALARRAEAIMTRRMSMLSGILRTLILIVRAVRVAVK